MQSDFYNNLNQSPIFMTDQPVLISYIHLSRYKSIKFDKKQLNTYWVWDNSDTLVWTPVSIMDDIL